MTFSIKQCPSSLTLKLCCVTYHISNIAQTKMETRESKKQSKTRRKLRRWTERADKTDSGSEMPHGLVC